MRIRGVYELERPYYLIDTFDEMIIDAGLRLERLEVVLGTNVCLFGNLQSICIYNSLSQSNSSYAPSKSNKAKREFAQILTS